MEMNKGIKLIKSVTVRVCKEEVKGKIENLECFWVENFSSIGITKMQITVR